MKTGRNLIRFIFVINKIVKNVHDLSILVIKIPSFCLQLIFKYKKALSFLNSYLLQYLVK